MKKLLSLFLALFLVTSCSDNADSFKGKMYKMVSAPEDMEITIGFAADENRFFGKAVNNYFGTYKSEGSEIVFGTVGMTMMAAPESMMKAESEYFAVLPEINAFELKGKKLVLKTASDKELVFEETGSVDEDE